MRAAILGTVVWHGSPEVDLNPPSKKPVSWMSTLTSALSLLIVF